MADAVDRGREAFRASAWIDASERLMAARAEGPLTVEDLERLAVACYLGGRDEDADAAWTRAHQDRLRSGDERGAARCAFWLAFGLMGRGDMARAGGWLTRAERLVEQQGECVERGYLMIAAALQQLFAGDPAAACPTFDDAITIGSLCHEPDLLGLARLGRGQALIALGRTVEGVRLLDEVMVSVTGGEVSPVVSGIVYCAVIEACHAIFDLRRAREWTAALGNWCDAQPQMAPYRGQCLVHRAEVMQLGGDWPGAVSETQRACERLAGEPALGDALYRRAELHRLRGEFVDADAAYRQASEWGRTPQPGLALLRLAQGRVDSAATTISRALEDAHDVPARLTLLPAYVEIQLAAAAIVAARIAADELALLANQLDAPMLHAVSGCATGALLLSENDPRAAIGVLHEAAAQWRGLDVPYEVARVRVLIGRACRMLGDAETAELELEAARGTFERLGAVPDAGRIADLTRTGTAARPAGLSQRELEVLVLIATGDTNRAIAARLTISEHTVARHVQNIFTKLGVSTRAAAGAFAFEHHLA